MINIICLGKIKEVYLTELIADYKNRIDKYHKINIIELRDTGNLKEEAECIGLHIKPRDYVIVCDIKGKKMDSLEFSRTVDRAFLASGTIDFIIGSSEGLDDTVKNRGNLIVSFSDLTMPHGLFRGVLLEQIYRAFKINNNETYHK